MAGPGATSAGLVTTLASSVTLPTMARALPFMELPLVMVMLA